MAAFLGRAFSAGSRFLARATPVASYIAKRAPSLINSAAKFSTTPQFQSAAARIGVNPNVVASVSRGINNVAGAVNLAPGVLKDVQSAVSTARGVVGPTTQSLAQLYKTAKG